LLNIPAEWWHSWLYDQVKEAGVDTGIREMKFTGNFERELHIVFESEKHETFFILKYL